MKFSVVDVETTGLFPKKHDRIIEIAVVQVDETGGTHREYSTLVNPQRDIGATRIHNICSRDVLEAPIFDDIAGSIVELLRNAVFVAHNAYFDESFVRSEFQRIQHPLPPFPTLCTMMLSSDAGCAAGSRRLDDLCCYFGIEHQEAHSALGDARATAHLLLRLMGTVPGGAESAVRKLEVKGLDAATVGWPDLAIKRGPFPREMAAVARTNEESPIRRVLARLSKEPTCGMIGPYYDMLDRVLEDRRISDYEIEEMLTLAHGLGLSEDDARDAHRQYC